MASKSSQLPHIAGKIPDRAQVESRIKRLSRWLDNEHVKEEIYFLPYAALLLPCLSLETLVLVMDGSVVGRGCCALMIHLLYKGRSLPLAWRVRQSPKGHFPERFHIDLIECVQGLIPEGQHVVFLGDGEFDGVKLQEQINELGWFYACRTSKSTVATWKGIDFTLSFLSESIKPGLLIELKEVQFTRDTYGPVLVLCCWEKGYAEPLYLFSNLSSAEDAIYYYKKRYRIETFFSD